jgi:phosphatidylinositol-3-phosphatase
VSAVRHARWAIGALVVAVALLGATACGGDDTTTTSTTATTQPAPTASTPPTATVAAKQVCGNAGRAPHHYESVVVFAFENRTWARVGTGFGSAMPYLHALGASCAYFTHWSETDPTQNSLTQYVGQVTGARQPGTRFDCSPSSTCSTQADNVFRQARTAGLDAVNYVEGATAPCSASGNAAKHVPALYLWAPEDRAHCNEQVRPFFEFDVDHLPAFAFVTPTLCNDGHDCDDATVDRWASQHVQPLLDSAAYRAGKVAVFIWYDEDREVPNLWIAPTAKPGPLDLTGAGYAGTLAAWESMLGLPCLADACHAPDMRAAANA